MFVLARPNPAEIALAHEDVRSVVVLKIITSNGGSARRFLRYVDKRGFPHSFAKTPLKAAQAPLAAASASQGVVMRIMEGFDSVGSCVGRGRVFVVS